MRDVDFMSFRELVAQMRTAQKEFFRTKSRTALDESKRLENAVDRALSENQMSLFDQPREGSHDKGGVSEVGP